jgi:hypothetical protein
MSNYPVGRPPRSADPQSKLRLAALTAVIAGVVLLAAAAFVLSYSGIHEVALQAGVSPNLAKLYPVIFDAMLVVAGAAAMALRGAGWWSRFYAWACLILLLAAVALGDAVHATNTTLPERASRAVVAITPWVLLLLAFGLLLTMLRHFRRARATVVARQEARAAAAGDAGSVGRSAEANGTATGRSAVTWATAGAAGTTAAAAGTTAGAAGIAAGTEARALPQPVSALDMLLGPRAGQAPAIEAPPDAGIDDDDSQSDPVSYGEETGYVHPDSYRDEGEYSPHGDSGGPAAYTGYLGQDEPAGDGDGAAQRDTAPGNGAGDAPTDAGAQPGQAGPADPAGPAGPADDGTQPGQADSTVRPGQADSPAQAGQADAAQTAQADSPAQVGQAEAAQPGQASRVSQAEAAADSVPAGEQAKDDASAEPAAAQSPGLERMRSTPTRPEE